MLDCIHTTRVTFVSLKIVCGRKVRTIYTRNTLLCELVSTLNDFDVSGTLFFFHVSTLRCAFPSSRSDCIKRLKTVQYSKLEIAALLVWSFQARDFNWRKMCLFWFLAFEGHNWSKSPYSPLLQLETFPTHILIQTPKRGHASFSAWTNIEGARTRRNMAENRTADFRQLCQQLAQQRHKPSPVAPQVRLSVSVLLLLYPCVSLFLGCSPPPPLERQARVETEEGVRSHVPALADPH